MIVLISQPLPWGCLRLTQGQTPNVIRKVPVCILPSTVSVRVKTSFFAGPWSRGHLLTLPSTAPAVLKKRTTPLLPLPLAVWLFVCREEGSLAPSQLTVCFCWCLTTSLLMLTYRFSITLKLSWRIVHLFLLKLCGWTTNLKINEYKLSTGIHGEMS